MTDLFPNEPQRKWSSISLPQKDSREQRLVVFPALVSMTMSLLGLLGSQFPSIFVCSIRIADIHLSTVYLAAGLSIEKKSSMEGEAKH